MVKAASVLLSWNHLLPWVIVQYGNYKKVMITMDNFCTTLVIMILVGVLIKKWFLKLPLFKYSWHFLKYRYTKLWEITFYSLECNEAVWIWKSSRLRTICSILYVILSWQASSGILQLSTLTWRTLRSSSLEQRWSSPDSRRSLTETTWSLT